MHVTCLSQQITHRLHNIYSIEMLHQHGYQSFSQLTADLLAALCIDDDCPSPQPHTNHWDEQRVILITYADTLYRVGEKPLATLDQFLQQYCQHTLSDVHLLPFYPYSSDDGFSVIDYSSVNPSHGSWTDINNLAKHRNLMFDLVINHCSARSQWFSNFIAGEGKGYDYFYTADPKLDLSMVTRPRTSPLLQAVQTAQGIQHVWCTFSHDQIDFDFSNPKVLLEFAQIISLYLDNGARLFRLDAVAFLWKEIGTRCINHHKTHEIIKLYRLLIEHRQHNAIIITETNIPNHENLLYFGNANEAHAIYNFALPPLLLHTMVTGNASMLRNWLMSMPPAQNGTTYFNFIASHDGIGLRPVEGILSPQQVQEMVDVCTENGAKINWRTGPNGQPSPYEINIALFDACASTRAGEDAYQLERFICMHAIMLAKEGIPGVYIHSLFGTPNDYERVVNTGQNRSINRHRWDMSSLTAQLNDHANQRHQVFMRLNQLLRLRVEQAAFHPNAIQFTLQLGDEIFGLWRQSLDRQQSIFCLYNVTNKTQILKISDINLISGQHWFDLISYEHLTEGQTEIVCRPYQAIWLTNRRTHK